MRSKQPLDWADPPWTLTFPGLSEGRGTQILEVLDKAGLASNSELLSPLWTITMTFDRVTVELLLVVLNQEPRDMRFEVGADPVRIRPDEAFRMLDGVIEEMTGFLEDPSK